MRFVRRPSPAMVVAWIALLVALGGTGYAAVKLPRNSVGTRQLKSNAVTGAKVKDGSLGAKDFAAGELSRGPQGPEGPQGAQGPQGPAGGGGGGASNVLEAVNDTSAGFVTLGAGSASASPVVTLSNVPAGSYLVSSVVELNGSGSARVVCETILGDAKATGIATVGGVAGAQSQSMIPTLLTVTTTSAGTAQTKCWTEALSGSAPFAAHARIAALKVGSATSTAVTG